MPPQGAVLYVTMLEPTTEPSEAAPARVYAPPTYLLRFLKSVCQTLHVDQHQREVCRLSPWDDVAVWRNPYPTHYRPAFACSLILYPPPPQRTLRFAFPAGCPAGETTGLPRSAAVTVWVRSRLSAGGAPSAPEEFGASGPDHVPFGPSVKASCRLAFMTTFNSASHELTLPHHPGSRPP